MNLYSPPDIDEAYTAWKASCGPAALAAIIRRPVMATREMLPDFRGWLNPTGMMRALFEAGAFYQLTPQDNRLIRRPPVYGLAFLQFSGGWWDNKPAAVQYRHTHWVGMAGTMVYDINSGEWWTRERWRKELFPMFLETKKCKRAWIRTAYEVSV